MSSYDSRGSVASVIPTFPTDNYADLAPAPADAVTNAVAPAGTTATPPRPVNPPLRQGRCFTIGDALVFGGGVFVLMFSFLPFVSYDEGLQGPLERSGYDTWFNAWETETFMAPLTWFVILVVVAAAGLSAVRYFASGTARVLSFTIEQLHVVFFLFATIVLLGYATSTKSVFFGTAYAQDIGGTLYENGINFSVGGFLMLTFAIIGTVGAALNLYHVGAILFPGSVRQALSIRPR